MPKKTFLLQKVQTPTNLRQAWNELNKSNRSSYGLSTDTIENFGKNIFANLGLIRRNLRQGRFSFSPVRAVVVKKKKPSGSIKKRGIRISEVRDRVAQRAITRVMEPYLRDSFHLKNDASFAYLKDRSVKKAMMRMISLYKQGNPFVLEADIEKFFDNVDREKLLKKMVFPCLPDASLNSLIESSLDQEIGNWGEVPEDDWECFPGTGIPQGGALSPLFANVYLSDFDRKMLEAGFGLIRYADDFIIMCKDAREAKCGYNMAKDILEGELGLKLHALSSKVDAKTSIKRLTDSKFEFLGIRFNGQRVWPSQNKINELKLRLRIITEFRSDKNLRRVLSSTKNVIEGWLSAYCFTDIEPYLQDIDEYIKTRIGICAFRMGWVKNNCALSQRQYRFSGIPNLKDFLTLQRSNLSKQELEIFNIKR